MLIRKLTNLCVSTQISYSGKRGTYIVDISYLNAVVHDDTPNLSMRQINEGSYRARTSRQTSIISELPEIGAANRFVTQRVAAKSSA